MPPEPATLGELAALIGGRVVGDPATPVTEVAHDSRAAGPGVLFVAVRGFSVDGHRYRSTIAVYGGVHLMVFNATMRKETGYQAGDTIQITLERDTEIRKITLPEDIRSWLENAGVAEVYDNYSYSHQKEVLDWINDTKNPETRKRRIAKLAEKLSSEKKQ